MAKLICSSCKNADMTGAQFVETGIITTYTIVSGTGEADKPLKLKVEDIDNSDWQHTAICPKCDAEFDAEYSDDGEGDAFNLEFTTTQQIEEGAKISTREGEFTLSEEEAHMLANALRVAADRYADDVKILATVPGHSGMAKQFERQENMTRNLITKLADLGYC